MLTVSMLTVSALTVCRLDCSDCTHSDCVLAARFGTDRAITERGRWLAVSMLTVLLWRGALLWPTVLLGKSCMCPG